MDCEAIKIDENFKVNRHLSVAAMEYYILGNYTRWLFGAWEIVFFPLDDMLFSEEAIFEMFSLDESEVNKYRISKVTSDVSNLILTPVAPGASTHSTLRVSGKPKWSLSPKNATGLKHTEWITIRAFVNQRIDEAVRLGDLLHFVNPQLFTEAHCIAMIYKWDRNVNYCCKARLSADVENTIVDKVLENLQQDFQLFLEVTLQRFTDEALNWIGENVVRRKLYRYYRILFIDLSERLKVRIPEDQFM